MRLRPLIAAITAALAVLATLAACISPATKKAAAKLADRLADMPGVASVSRTIGNNEGTAVVRITVVLTDGATARQIAALAGPLNAATKGDHPLNDLQASVERGTRPAGALAPSTLALNSRDTPAQVAPFARRFLALSTVVGMQATVAMATAGIISVRSVSDAADPIGPVATALTTYREPVGTDVEVIAGEGSPVRSLRTEGVPTRQIVARWQAMSAHLVRLPGGHRTGLSQRYFATGLSSIYAHLDLPPGTQADQLTVGRYGPRLRPMIEAQLRVYLTMGPSTEYVLDYAAGQDDIQGRLVWIGPGGEPGVSGTGGFPAPRPAGWNTLALDFLRTHR